MTSTHWWLLAVGREIPTPTRLSNVSATCRWLFQLSLRTDWIFHLWSIPMHAVFWTLPQTQQQLPHPRSFLQPGWPIHHQSQGQWHYQHQQLSANSSSDWTFGPSPQHRQPTRTTRVMGGGDISSKNGMAGCNCDLSIFSAKRNHFFFAHASTEFHDVCATGLETQKDEQRYWNNSIS